MSFLAAKQTNELIPSKTATTDSVIQRTLERNYNRPYYRPFSDER